MGQSEARRKAENGSTTTIAQRKRGPVWNDNEVELLLNIKLEYKVNTT